MAARNPKGITGDDTRSRARRHRHAQQQDIRDKFKGIEYVRQLELISKELIALQDSIDKLIKQRAPLYAKDDKTLTVAQKTKRKELTDKMRFLNTKLDVLMKRADLNFRRLKFVLPELRAMELTDGDGKNPFESFFRSLKEAVQDDG